MFSCSCAIAGPHKIFVLHSTDLYFLKRNLRDLGNSDFKLRLVLMFRKHLNLKT